MSELTKPYKVTLWEDKNVYIVNGQKKYSLDVGDVIQNQFLEETCIATIGSNTMETPIKIFTPILIQELNGSKTFTFQIFSRYWEEESEDFKINPFINLLVNERKIKLFYDNKWYDFVIKQIQENSENYTFSYTCKDLFINELGKTGYEVELATELQNNMGTIKELSSYILEGTDWSEKDSDLLVQRDKESLYLYQLPTNISAVNMLNPSETILISSGKFIFIFYSCKANLEPNTQFLYVDATGATTYDEAKRVYKIDEDGFITNSNNWKLTSGTINYNNVTQISNYFGEKLIQKQKSKFIPQIGETCTIYAKNNQQYYCYTETEYASVAEIQDLLSNNSNFLTTNGWFVQDGESGSIALSTYTTGSTVYRTLSLNGSAICNSGIYDNRAILSPQGVTAGEQYIFAVKADNNARVTGANIIAKHKESSLNDKTLFTFSSSSNGTGILSGYKVFMGSCLISVSYQSLISDYQNIIFKMNLNGTINLIEAKVFKYRTDGSGNMLVPDLQNVENSVIKTKYNFFPVNTDFSNIYGKEDLVLTETRFDTSGYSLVMVSNYEKVTSISGSKSNRFNLIQNCCEAFECWANFTIDHDEKGKILYEYIPLTSSKEVIEGGRYYTRSSGSSSLTDDTIFTIVTNPQAENYSSYYKKVYHKYVTFKKYIGEENFVGFRYGINLKSIQRNIVSDQIASKVIVQPNANDFAPNGSCTIQQAILNPTGENALYNFQYFINHGLLDPSSLYDDLYGTNGGLGFFIKMREWNNQIAPEIEELAKIGNVINNLESKQIIYDTLLEEAQKLQANIIQEIEGAGYTSSGSVNDPQYIQALQQQKNSYASTIADYTSIATNNRSLLTIHRTRYNFLLNELKEISEKKNKLNSEFHKKYYRFIQEGTWTSNDYYDPELYYQAANMVLYTSSFPQVSYTINVIELSQLEGFEPYQFNIADKTYIEDVEFFGYDAQHRPYKEEIVISQIKSNLDDPSQNTITIQNYKTQFQDLFQRIAATSQALQYNEGVYNRAANAVNSNGTFDSVLLQNSLKENELIIKNAKNQSVSWDETGITISNFKNANEIVRLTSGGIVLSVDGGQSWTTGITGNGINADVITTGRLDTDRIRIFGNNMQTFEWNSKGISAFAWNENQGVSTNVDYSKFVRYDQYGLYGYMGDTAWEASNISDVLNNSIFSLTWKGLNFNLSGGQGGFSAVQNPQGNPVQNFWYERVGSNYFLSTDTSVQSGKIYYVSDNNVININNRFIVDGQGNVKATSGTFTGNVIATSGTISGLEIRGGTLGIGENPSAQTGYNFYVDASGNLFANSGVFNGNIYAPQVLDSSGNSLFSQYQSGYNVSKDLFGSLYSETPSGNQWISINAGGLRGGIFNPADFSRSDDYNFSYIQNFDLTEYLNIYCDNGIIITAFDGDLELISAAGSIIHRGKMVLDNLSYGSSLPSSSISVTGQIFFLI